MIFTTYCYFLVDLNSLIVMENYNSLLVGTSDGLILIGNV